MSNDMVHASRPIEAQRSNLGWQDSWVSLLDPGKPATAVCVAGGFIVGTLPSGCGSKLNRRGKPQVLVGMFPCFHLPGFQFGIPGFC